MKCVFVLRFYNALYWRFYYAPLCRVFTNRVTNSEKLQLDQQSLTPRSDIGVTRAKNPSNLTTKINDNIRGLLVTASISSGEKPISDQPSISSSGSGESSANKSTGLILTNSNKASNSNMTLFDHSTSSVGESAPIVSLQNSEILLEVRT